MVNVLTKTQAGTGLSILDAIGISLSKSFVVDGVATPLISGFTRGNSLMNAFSKIGGAILVNQFLKNKIGGIVATSMIVSAGDDLIRPITNTSSNQASAGRIAGSDTFGQSNVQLPTLSTL